MKERSQIILREVIQTYIQGGLPVGSRLIAKASKIALSSASIRNTMSDLEENGFLQQPHTSAGRIPTVKALKFYVDELLEEHQAKNDGLMGSTYFPNFSDAEEMMEYISLLLGNKTGATSFVVFNRGDKKDFQKRIYYGCQSNILNKPEFSDVQKVHRFLRALEEKEEFINKMNTMHEGLNIKIGEENNIKGLEECSLVASSYHTVQNECGMVGVVGPLRMDYAHMIDIVTTTAHTLSKKLR
ncbi:MAG TPA: hypothetical protein VJB34_02085 [Bdellovibrionota bacterium]|nr:hypothetical protein [Bdellovibrionota bacterium]